MAAASDDEYGYDSAEFELPPSIVDDPGRQEWLLVLAGVSIVLSLGLLVLGGLALNVVGYVLSSLVAFSLVAMFRRNAANRFVAVGIGAAPSTAAFSIALLLAGLVVAALQAYAIARHFA